MNINKININQSEQTYYIASDIYDVSYHNNGVTFESLSVLLGSDNLSTLIPTSVRCGGMTIRFVQSSDNKYVQYRLMSASFSTDTTQWAVDNESVYLENPEFIYVKKDADDRLLWWIYQDGSVDWAKGVPQPIQEELKKLEQLIKDNAEGNESVVARVTANESSILEINEGLENIVARVASNEAALDRKVDGVYEESPEFIRVYKDADGRILNAITLDGTNYLPKANINEFYLDDEVVDNDALKSQTFEQNQEFAKIIKDSDDRILFGIDNNGDIISEYLNKIKKAIPDKEKLILKSDIEYKTLVKRSLDSKTMEFAALFTTSGECESFLFFTDPHLGGANNNFDTDTFYEAMGVVKRYFDTTPTSFVLCGGDWLNSKDYQANACEKLGFIDAYMNSHFNSYFPIFGNHDCNYQGIVSADDDSNGNLGNQVVSNLMFRKWGRKYYTFKVSITRFYIFDTGID